MKNLRGYALGLLISTLIVVPSGFVYAQAIGLSSIKVEKANSQETNYTGLCGPATVKIMDVTEISGDIFKVNNGKLIIKSDKKELVLDEIFSDYNGVACVKTKTADRLLVWSNCAGSGCGDNFHFFVIDLQKLTVIVPKKGKTCDDKCASKILGNKLPQKINSRQ